MVWFLVGFLIVVGGLLLLELALDDRRARGVSKFESVASGLFWLGLALTTNAVIFFLFEQKSALHAEDITGYQASVQFLSAFLSEAALGLDNVVVIAAMFAHFKVPRVVQYRLLMVGAVAAIAARGLLIAGGTALLNSFDWTRFVFGVLLVLSALRMILVRQENMDPDRNLVVAGVRRIYEVGREYDGRRFITRINGKRAFTLLAIVLVMAESADAFFAFDSVIAGMAFTTDPIILFTSNTLAVLALRSAFLLLTRYIGWLRYFKVSLVLLLGFLAFKMFSPPGSVPQEITLAVLLSLLTAGGVASMLGSRPDPALLTSQPSPLGEDAERLARVTLKQARRAIVLVIGTSIVLLGLFMMIGPGPGIVVVPIGLGILATEFIWAKRLLDRYADVATKLGKRAGAEVMKRTRLWHVPVVIGATLAGWWVLHTQFDVRTRTVLMMGVPMLIGQLVWAVMLVLRWRKQRDDRSRAPRNGELPNGEPPNA